MPTTQKSKMNCSLPSSGAKLLAVLTAFSVLAVADSQSADAQGLLRRLRSRIEAQAAPRPIPQPAPRVQPNTQPNTQPSNPAQNQSGLRPVQPKDDDRTKSEKPPVDEPEARPTLGLDVVQAPGVNALQITRVGEHSKAGAVGLRAGDLIVSANGKPTRSVAEIRAAMAGVAVGQTMPMQVVRNRILYKVQVPVVASPTTPAQRKPGSSAIAQSKLGTPTPAQSRDKSPRVPTLAPPINTPTKKSSSILNRTKVATQETAIAGQRVELGIEIEDARGARGVIVAEVDPQSPASTAGVQVGDRIVSVDGKLISNSESLARDVIARSLGDTMDIQLVRNGQLVESQVVLEKPSAVARDNVATSTADKKAEADAFGGLGSMIGGFFGGSTANSGAGADTTPQPAAAPADETLPAKKPDVAAKEMKLRKEPLPNDLPFDDSPFEDFDVLDFGDDEPVAQASFDEEMPAPKNAAPRNTAPKSTAPNKPADRPVPPVSDVPLEFQSDPPSLEKIDIPQETSVLELSSPVNSGAVQSLAPESRFDEKSTSNQRSTVDKLKLEIERLKKRLEELEAKTAK